MDIEAMGARSVARHSACTRAPSESLLAGFINLRMSCGENGRKRKRMRAKRGFLRRAVVVEEGEVDADVSGSPKRQTAQRASQVSCS
jgi:hypothetical protein